MKTIQFWKAYGISNLKNNVVICPMSYMAAILQNGCREKGFRQYLSFQITQIIKNIHLWKAFGISKQKNNVAIFPESHMAAILQNGGFEIGFRQYLSLQITQSMKTTHFWKAYGISNQQINAAICPESYMAAILQNGCLETQSMKIRVFAESVPDEYVQAILNADVTGLKLYEDYVTE